ncbi:uncharacterized protein METZ01_LOCUS413399 [marine metagenome]|uniref:Uncharacterized protein n=1 Tax=marine metagenome TaxID=408172 RepID=A0A382WQ74_9ZZZZ
MVSKGNNNRKKSIKTEKPKEKAEVPVANVVETITQTVVSVLKPDLDNKIETINQSIQQIGESLKNQLQNEIKDIRSQIPQPQTQPSDEQRAEILSQSEPPLEQQQQSPSIYGIPMDLIARAVLAYITPKPADNSAMMNTFQQAQIRKGMAEMSFDDWFMKQLKQKIAKEYLHMDIPKEVAAADEEYMKPLRSVGVNAIKREEMDKMHKQQSNMHQERDEEHE